MLNISDNEKDIFIHADDFESYKKVYEFHLGRRTVLFFASALTIGILILFLPWTQTIQGTGKVTALYPNQKPQSIYAIVGGRILQWYVREGQSVSKGDTLVLLAEVKDAYWDPELLQRTQQQLQAKEASLIAYNNKIQFYDNQIFMIEQSMALKLQQAQNKLQQAYMKVASDSADLHAVNLNLQIADNQLKRQEELFKKGIVSLKDLEERRIKFQESQAKFISQSNKLLQSRNELINAQIEMDAIKATYNKDLYKAQSEKQSAISERNQAQADVAKFSNQLTNYELRQKNYAILATQDGYVSEVFKSGVGEIIKEGEALLSILPLDYKPAIEMFVSAYDIPLIIEDAEVRIQFDGWPAFVFSGWPNASFGTFGGRIFTYDPIVTSDGKFRILVTPDPLDQPWPKQIKVGSGCLTWTLLKDVPIWWELWRIFNGFPPDFYDPRYNDKKKEKKKDKKNKSEN